MSSIIPLDEEALAQIGYTPLGFLRAMLNGDDLPPIYRLDDDLGFAMGDFAAWRGKARMRALIAQGGVTDRVIDASSSDMVAAR